MIFGFPTLKVGSSEAGDPFWASVSLLLKMEGATGSKTLVDRSSYAVNGTLPTFTTATAEISAGSGRAGGGAMLTNTLQPTVTWSGTRFNKPVGKGVTIEGWFKVTSPLAGFPAPGVFRWGSVATGLASSEFGKAGATNQAVARFDQGVIPGEDASNFAYENYTPDADGWVYYCQTVTVAGRARIWVNNALLHDSNAATSFVADTQSGELRLFGWAGANEDFAMGWLHGEFRFTQEDRYPSGPSSFPSSFPVGPA